MKKPFDENEARRLLQPLAGEPETDPRIDVAETMRRGAQLRRQRRIANGAAYATVLAVTVAGGLVMLPAMGNRQQTAGPAASSSASGVPSEWTFGSFPSNGAPPAPEGPACGIEDFPVRDAQLYVTDSSGRWSATGASDSPGPLTPSILDDGMPAGSVTVPAQPIVVTAINTSGDAAVTSTGDGSLPWAYVGGVATLLRGGAGTVTAINDAKQFGGTLEGGARPVVWDGPTADPVDLPMPEGYDTAEVIGVGNDGTVAGAVADVTGDSRYTRQAMALWLPDGTTRLVPGEEENLVPTAMGTGWVIGREGSDRGFRYEIAADRYETLPGQLAAPVAVTGAGTVVGLAGMHEKAVYGVGPYVLLGDEVRPLEQPGDARYVHISGITEYGGTIFGTIETTDGKYRAVTWSC